MEHMEHILEQNGAQNGTHGTQDACLDTHVWTTCLDRKAMSCATAGRLRKDESGQTLQGSFTAVSKPNFENKNI